MLMDAVTRGRLYQVKYLLDTHTHDVNKTDENKQTALIKTVFLDDNLRLTRQKIARVLLAHGADVNTVDREGKTALIWASIMGRRGIVKTLLEGAIIDLDMNATDNAGNTALFYAASEGCTEIVRLLVKAMLRFGLDIDKKNARGMTPILEATKRGHDLCAQVLMTVGQASLTTRDPQMFLNTPEWAQKRSLPHLSESIAQRAPSPCMVVQNVDDDDDEDDPEDASSQQDGLNAQRTVLSRSRSNSHTRTQESGVKVTKALSQETVRKLSHQVQKPSRYLSTPELHSDKNTETRKLSKAGSIVSLKRRKNAQMEKRTQPVTAKSEMCRLLGLYGIRHSEAFRQGYDPISLPPSGFWPDPLAHLRDDMSTVSSDDLESLCELKPRLSLNRRTRRPSLMPGSSLNSSFGRRVSNIPASHSSGLKGFLESPGRRTSLVPQGDRNRRPQISRRVTTMSTVPS